MASIIKVDQIQSDSGFVDIKTINYAANTTSNTSWSPLFNRLDLPNGCFVGGYNNPSTSLFWAGTNILWDGSNYKNIMTANSALYSTSAGAHSFYSMDSAPAGSTISLTGVFSVNKDKTLALQGTSSQIGTGITFPGTQNASADPNTLDDYEEGTFSPTFYTDGDNSTISFTNNTRYIKIGRLVWFSLYSLRNQVSVTSGTLYMTGLPYAPATAQPTISLGGLSWFDNGGVTTDYTAITYVEASGGGKVFFTQLTNPAQQQSNRYVQAQNLTNSRPIYITGSYMAND